MKFVFSITYFVALCLATFPMRVDAYSPKLITANEKPFKDASVIYGLYEGNSSLILQTIYKTTPKYFTSVIYDLDTGKELLNEKYEQNDIDKLKYETFLAKLNVEAVNGLQRKYQQGKGFYYEVPGGRIYVTVSGKCSSLFDSYYEIVSDKGLTIEKNAILLTGDLTHTSNPDCENMQGNTEIKVTVKSMSISGMWKINEELTAITLHEYPMIFYVGKNSTIESNFLNYNNMKIVSYEWLKQMIVKIEDEDLPNVGLVGESKLKLNVLGNRILELINNNRK